MISQGSNSNSVILWSLMGAGLLGLFAASLPVVLMRRNGEDPTMVSSISQTQALLLMGVSLIVGLGAFFVHHQRKNGSYDVASTTTSLPNSMSSKRSTAKLRNIWDAGKRTDDRSKKEMGYSDKPFGSKYYYAHNNPNATGGYKDGLRMEDYRMNGPRLLSKNGMRISDNTAKNDDAECKDNSSSSNNEDADNIVGTETSSMTERTDSSRIVIAKDTNIRNITKYLWDDPGDSNGIATIRIDVLPDKRPGEFLEWKDVSVEDVSATLSGEGLVVKITTTPTTTASSGDGGENGDNPLFRLKIDKLYGDAADVKCIIKPKRLLIKIYKKKNSFLSSFNKRTNNLDSWPQPHRKI
ncbi:hypothetical protein IV203_002188 [Nitzschia inconspicua]|uniref:Uncharacterized protein n=1 Tax=Nitzschia inconspicua TaxID=303405 RepID=A0A9K3L836_9STRA|nr:hypothetical protein IV203_002188 [Nitzschia inconspicua]